MTDNASRPAFLPPLILTQDMQSLASHSGLQEIVRTYREVMERNDREFDSLIGEPVVARVTKIANDSLMWDPVWFEDTDKAKQFREGRLTRPHRQLVAHLERVIGFMRSLGVPDEVDLGPAQRDIQQAARLVDVLRAHYNRWRLDQSNIVAANIREAIVALSTLGKAR
jgi:hypothetical protein